MSKAINETYLKNLEPTEKKQEILIDQGLYFVVHPTGKKSWAYRYRMIGGRRAKVVLGRYPALSLREAKKQALNIADTLKTQAVTVIEAKKIKIQETKIIQEKEEKEQIFHDTGIFSVISHNFFENMLLSSKSPKTANDQRKRVEKNILPICGHQNINDIEMMDIKKAIDIIVGRGRIETANRTLDLVKQIFEYARTLNLLINENAFIINDIAGLKKFLPKQNVTHLYKKHLEKHEIAELMQKIHDSRHRWTLQVSVALRLAPYLFLRPSELVGIEWSEVDLEKGCIKISAKRMKMGRDHVVPLSSQAIELIKEIGQYTANSDYVFCSRTNKPITPDTLRMCLRRLGYETIKGDTKPFTTHSFRGLASSILHQELRYPSDIVEFQLAHVEDGSVKAAYNRLGAFAMYEERKAMMQAYADYLDNL